MLASLVQTKTGTSNLASTVVAFDNNTVAGNSIVVIGGNSSTTSGDISGVTDSQGSVYTKVNTTANATVGELEIWYTSGIIGGADTITVAYTTGVACAVIIREYSGLIYAASLDKQTATTGNSANLSSGNTGALAQNSELLIGAGLIPLANTFSAGGNFVNLVSVGAPLVVAVAAEDLLVTTGGVQAATFTANASAQWVCAIATFFLMPTGTTTSTSSTSMSSTSTRSTSTSISSTSSSSSISSTSISSSSISTSSTSSSTSTSSTSSSISSTSSSTSSTSTSSTSSSTSISSTSSSISSTSTSSTSTSSTSSSTSISSTSTSFSSTSSSQSSTSASTSSTSFSSTSSSSSTSTTTLPPPYDDYSYQDSLSLPSTGSDPTNSFNISNYSDVLGDDPDYFIEYGSEYIAQNYQRQAPNNTYTPSFTWRGRTTYDTRISPMYIQILNQNIVSNLTIDSYSESNSNTSLVIAANELTGQTFTGNGNLLGRCSFYLMTDGSTGGHNPLGKIKAQIYDHTGSFGAGGAPTNASSPLATSDMVDASVLTGSLALVSFNFSGANQIKLNNGTNYTVVLNLSNMTQLGALVSPNQNVRLGVDTTSPTHPGNTADSTNSGTTWSGISGDDTVFYVYATPWETLAVINTVPADTDFSLTVIQSANLSNYYDTSNYVTFRSYQQVI